MKTQAEHIAAGGDSCPVCGSDETEGGFVETGGGEAVQKVYCLACRSSWVDGYTLTGFSIINEMEPETLSLDN